VLLLVGNSRNEEWYSRSNHVLGNKIMYNTVPTFSISKHERTDFDQRKYTRHKNDGQ
jgi:hypothetical protein